MKKYNILFLFVFFNSACNHSNNETVITEFPNKLELTAKIINTKPVIFLPEKMFIINDRLWILQSRKDTVFDVFQLNNGKYLYNTGTKGRGPNEFTMVNNVQFMKNEFTIAEFSEIKICEIADDGSLKVTKKLAPFRETPINGFHRLNENLAFAFAYCLTGRHGEHEYRMVDLFTKKEKIFSLYPNLTGIHIEDDQRCLIYVKHIVSNQKTRQFATFYVYFKHIRFYNFTGDIEKEIRLNIEPFHQEDIVNDRKLYYREVQSTERFIYALCVSNPYSEDTGLELQVWDWDGTPIIQYVIKDVDLDAFVISENEKKMYGTTWDEGHEDKIYVYDLFHLE